MSTSSKQASMFPRRHIQSEVQLSSTLAGLTARLLLHPVDSVKTRVQNLRGRTNKVNAPLAITRFIRRDGIRGLYRGIIGSLIGVIPYSMLYMPSYEFSQRMMASRFGTRDFLSVRHVFAGAVAGLCGSLVKVPMDVVKKRLQAGLYSNVTVAVRSIANEGVGFLGTTRRFYAGWRSAVLYDVPYNAVQFTVLENVKKAYCKNRKVVTGLDNVLIGAFTGMVTSLMTEPLDVVKTRMMTQKVRGAGNYKGWWDCVSRIVGEEGVRALWKGTLPRLVWVAASSAIWYGTYQTARETLGRRRIEKSLAPD